MKTKLVGILICMLLIATALPAVGIRNVNKATNVEESISQDESIISEIGQQSMLGDDFDWQRSGENIYTGHGGDYPDRYVGIGTTSPLNKLEVFATSSHVMSLKSSAGYNTELKILNSMDKGGMITASSNSGNLNFYRYDAGSGSLSMTIDNSNGYVGIGTFAHPDSRLHIKGNNSVGNIGFAEYTRDFWFDGGSDGLFVISNMGDKVNGSTCFQHFDGVNETELLLIKNNGNVGIGTTNPSYLLDVDGGSGIVAQFSGRVKGADAVNDDEFATKKQVDSVSISRFTPTGTSDSNGNVGDTAWDDNFYYVKTPDGWKRAALETWETPSLQAK